MRLTIGKQFKGPFSERFKRFVMPVTESGCFLWIGSVNSEGYGQIQIDGSSRGAHRIAYELAKGPIPNGLQIDHLCRVRCCVNPDHLESVTAKVNTLRGKSIQARNALKTICSHGHQLNGRNLYFRPNGNRACKMCFRDATRRCRARKNGSGFIGEYIT